MLHQSIRVRDLPENPKWKPVTDARDDARARRDAEGRGGRGAGGRRGGSAGGGGGTEPEVIKKGKTDKEGGRRTEEVGRILHGSAERREADCRAGQSRSRVSRHAAQRRVHGRRRDRAAARADAGDGAVAGARRVRREEVRRRAAAARQAADVHEPQRRRGGGAGALLRHRARPICWSWSTKWRCRSAGCARGRADRRAGTTASSRSSSGLGPRNFPGCGWGWGAATARRDLADHVLSKFEPDERPVLEEFITRAADAAEMFAADRHRQGDERVQPGGHGSGTRLLLAARVRLAGPDSLVQKETHEQEVRARLRRVARRDRRAGRRPAHAGRGDRPAHGRPDREDRELGPPQARLRDRPAQGRHLRARADRRLAAS